MIALAGVGDWGKNLLREFHKLNVLRLIYDIKDFSHEIETTKDWSYVLSHPEITAIVISLPSELHYKYAKDALNNNKDVFVEKPMCLNLEEGRELVELAEKNNQILMVGHLLQYHPAIRQIKDLIDKNVLGKIYNVYCSRKNLGKLRKTENVMWSFAPHDISIILSILGKPLFIKCFGQQHLRQDIHDVTDTFMVFPNNCFGHISVNWLHHEKEQRLTITGSNGMLIFDDVQKKLIIHTDKRLVYDIKETPLEFECQHFLECCRERKTPLTDSREGLRVLEVLQECQQQLDWHDSVIIDKEAKIGKNTKIWHYTHVMKATIGENCTIGQNCFFGNGAILGDNCKVQNNVSVYSGVECGDNVFIGPSVVFCNDINPRAAYSKNGHYLKTIVKEGTSIGANATILPGVTLGEHCFIGAGSVVTKNVKPYAVVIGNPAKEFYEMDEKGNKKIYK
jgi:UDP-2-acetamido-3-amino-2,3-dideoxy-glucuronate N-acetyltransferase